MSSYEWENLPEIQNFYNNPYYTKEDMVKAYLIRDEKMNLNFEVQGKKALIKLGLDKETVKNKVNQSFLPYIANKIDTLDMEKTIEEVYNEFYSSNGDLYLLNKKSNQLIDCVNDYRRVDFYNLLTKSELEYLGF